MSITCDKCANFGLSFYADNIKPHEYIEGRSNSKIWIIGLNPKGNLGNVEKRDIQAFEDFKPELTNKEHAYFHDFRKVSKKLYENYLSTNSTVAHTDLVKCFSNSFPPKTEMNSKQLTLKSKDINTIIKNCSSHLFLQLKQHNPKVIICNGSAVCWHMLDLFPPKDCDGKNTLTSYQTNIILDNKSEHKFWVVLSGFIGRIDDRNKRRFGKEIEQILMEEKIDL